MPTHNRHRTPISRRQWGAAISEYLPLITLIAGLLITGFNHFGDTVRNRTADAATALAGAPMAPLSHSGTGHSAGPGGNGNSSNWGGGNSSGSAAGGNGAGSSPGGGSAPGTNPGGGNTGSGGNAG